jgi:hypothetical protein
MAIKRKRGRPPKQIISMPAWVAMMNKLNEVYKKQAEAHMSSSEVLQMLMANAFKAVGKEAKERTDTSIEARPGRPSKYDPKVIEQAAREHEAGVSLRELSKKYKIPHTTLAIQPGFKKTENGAVRLPA